MRDDVCVSSPQHRGVEMSSPPPVSAPALVKRVLLPLFGVDCREFEAVDEVISPVHPLPSKVQVGALWAGFARSA